MKFKILETPPSTSPGIDSDTESHEFTGEPEADTLNMRDEGLNSEDGFDLGPAELPRQTIDSKRLAHVRAVSSELQKEFPGDYRLESDLYTVGPTPFILAKIRKMRSTPKGV